MVKLQSKVLRILFNCYRTADAWKHSNSQISDIRDLYSTVIRKLCMKHDCGKLPHNFSTTIMPDFNINQLENKISRISLSQMYDYKNSSKPSISDLKTNCIIHWNSLSMAIKSLPYTSSRAL